MFDKIVPLHPELVPYLQMNGGIPGLFHPLVYSIFHGDAMNEHINNLYLHKKARLEEALAEGKFPTYVFLHERPYRCEAFYKIQSQLEDRDYWDLLADVYTDSENVWQHKTIWKELLGSARLQSELFMDQSEREAFNSLPALVTVYRGYQKGKNAKGWSYTLDEEKALWFAKRFSGTAPRVKTITVKKSLVLGLKTVRNEQEIVLRLPR